MLRLFNPTARFSTSRLLQSQIVSAANQNRSPASEKKLSELHAKPSYLPAYQFKVKTTPVSVLPTDSNLHTNVLCLNFGSRFEHASTPGMAHVFSRLLLSTTKRSNIVDIVRPLFGIGAEISVHNDRDNIYIVTQSHEAHSDFMLNTVHDAVMRSAHKYHEYKFAYDSCLIDLDNVVDSMPQAHLLDIVHQYVFRGANGLANSIYVKPSVGHSSEHLRSLVQYYQDLFYAPASFCAISPYPSAVRGKYCHPMALPSFFDYFDTNKLVNPAVNQPYALPNAKPSKMFYSGEVVVDSTFRRTHCAVVFPGLQAYSEDESTLAVLQKMLVGHLTKHHMPKTSSLFDGRNSNLSPSVDISAINLSYFDAGLFGFYISAYNNEIDANLEIFFNSLKQIAAGNFNYVGKDESLEEIFKAAKKSAKMDYLLQYDNGVEMAKDVARYTLFANLKKANKADSQVDYVSPYERADKIDQVKLEGVKALAKKIFSERPFMGVLGNIKQVKPLSDYF